MRKGTIALLGTAAALLVGFGFLTIRAPTPQQRFERVLVDAALDHPEIGSPTSIAPLALEATEAAVAGKGRAQWVSTVRPRTTGKEPWLSSHCKGGGWMQYLWVPYGSRVTPGQPVKIVLVDQRPPGTEPQAMWLILATSMLPEPVDFTSYGMPGCWLHIPLESVNLLLPGAEYGLFKRFDNTWKNAAGQTVGNCSVVEFTWTPSADHLGRALYAQGLLLAPGANRAGLIGTPAVELTVGTP